MKLMFGKFELEPATAELREDGIPVPMEKQVFDLLLLLADNSERVLSKDEIVEKVWDGRFISDSSISTAVKNARRAVGDDGSTQSVIKTVHGRGFRFVASVRRVAEAVPKEIAVPQAPSSESAPSIAVLPFAVLGEAPAGSAIGDAIPAELIAALSRLRWLFVTARASSFRFRGETPPPETLGEVLGVRYILAGTVEVLGDILTISTELMRTETGAVVWSNRYAATMSEIHDIRAEIVRDTVSALELHIPLTEAALARTRNPNEIGAWSHFHIGLQHIYRFNRADNGMAADHFRRALELDPDFARAHAGLSFTHWQTAFMHFGEDRLAPLAAAEASATRAAEIDPMDPFSNYNMARVFWLRGEIDAFDDWLDRALTINPNFAQASYARALANDMMGKNNVAISHSEKAMLLSPLDPLKYAMMSSKAMAMAGDEQFADAAELVEKACHLPGAHFYIDMIAAAFHKLAGNDAQATSRAARVLDRQGNASRDMFFSAFPYAEGVRARAAIDKSLESLGF